MSVVVAFIAGVAGAFFALSGFTKPNNLVAVMGVLFALAGIILALISQSLLGSTDHLAGVAIGLIVGFFCWLPSSSSGQVAVDMGDVAKSGQGGVADYTKAEPTAQDQGVYASTNGANDADVGLDTSRPYDGDPKS